MIYLLLSQKVLANFRQSKVLCSCMVQTSETYVSAKFTNCAPSTNIGKLNQNSRTLKYKVNVCIKKKIIGQVLVFPYLCQLLFPSQHFIMKLLGGGGGAQSCLTLCHATDCSPPGSSVPGTSQARILEWIFITYSKGSPRPRDGTHIFCISCVGKQTLYHQWQLGSLCLEYIAI